MTEKHDFTVTPMQVLKRANNSMYGLASGLQAKVLLSQISQPQGMSNQHLPQLFPECK